MIINERIGGFLKSIRTFNKDGVETTPKHIKQGVDNLIVNSGLDEFLISNGSNRLVTLRCLVGTGTTAPLVSDTALESQVASSAFNNTDGTNQTITDPLTGEIYNSAVKDYTFSLGSVIGNISEAAIESSGGVMVSRVLVRDTNGDPTVIPVTADDQLIITWEFRRYFEPAETTGSFTLTNNGVDSTINYTIYPTNPSQHRVAFMFIDGNNRLVSNFSVTGNDYSDYSFTGTAFGSSSRASYTDGNYYRDFTVSATAAQGSSGCNGIYTSISAGTSQYVIGFDQTIPKTSDDTLAITCRYTISRYVAP